MFLEKLYIVRSEIRISEVVGSTLLLLIIPK